MGRRRSVDAKEARRVWSELSKFLQRVPTVIEYQHELGVASSRTAHRYMMQMRTLRPCRHCAGSGFSKG